MPFDESDLIEFLARIYAAVPWHRMRTSRPRWDIWDHRLRQAATRLNLQEFASKLCNHLDLQSLPRDALDYLARLEGADEAVLERIYRAHSVVAARSAARAEELVAERRQIRQAKQLQLEIKEEDEN
jgi:hypothetical protein